MSFRIRDPIHNFIDIPDEFQSLINSKPFQRLRGIRQLALASLVYPGALHTRFDHTLGVTHIAGLMAKRFRLDKEETRLVQLAALLHDVGHGPFSHVSESSLDRFADPNAFGEDQKQHKIHELVTANIIRFDPSICKVLPDEEERNRIIRLLDEGHGRRLLKQIVSGPLDADKQDYLLRDGKFCGVEYGQFDLHQFQRSLLAIGEPGEEEIMVKEDSVHAVEQFILAKYYMTANVYRHRVRIVTDQMIGRAIQLGVEIDKVEPMQELYRFQNDQDFTTRYLTWDDGRFMEVFCPLSSNPPGKLSGGLLQRLRERKLLKQVYSERLENLDGRCRDTVSALSKKGLDDIRSRIEAAVAAFLSEKLEKDFQPDYVIAHSFSIKSVRTSAQNDEGEILVDRGSRPPRFLSEQSKLIGSINQAYSDDFVVIFAPIEWPNPGQKEFQREKWSEGIKQILEKLCKRGTGK